MGIYDYSVGGRTGTTQVSALGKGTSDCELTATGCGFTHPQYRELEEFYRYHDKGLDFGYSVQPVRGTDAGDMMRRSTSSAR